MRILKNWLEAYMEYTENTEPATIFHKWVGLSVIAGALRKKTHLALGRLKVYPNLYVVLVAEPGVARKSQSIDFGHDIITQIPELVVSADATTKEAMLDDLENCAVDEQLLDGSSFRHSSLSVISREFESFLGQKKENNKMLVLLTDLFDCKEIPWKYRTKHSGSNTIPSIYLNLLAATTPDSLASCLPSTAIGGGLTSRIIFVWADKKAKKVSRPVKSNKVIQLREELIKDLYLISRIVGQYEFSKDAGERWDNWYNEYEDMSTDRLCKDPTFNGWYSRKPMYTLKISTCIAASQSNELILRWEHIEKAFSIINEVESSMGKAFRAVGRSTVTNEVDTVATIIKNYKAITEKKLLSMIWRDVDSQKFNNVIDTILRTGEVKRRYTGPKGETGDIWYFETSYLNKLLSSYVKN